MADYFQRFSCVFDTGSVANAKLALALAADLETRVMERDGDSLGFITELAEEPDIPGGIWIAENDGCGDANQVIDFVFLCARTFKLSGRWGFTWSYGCSRPRIDAFSGGACVLDLGIGVVVDDLDCACWVAELVNAPRCFRIYSAKEAAQNDGAGYWSNEGAWVDEANATVFGMVERHRGSLPLSIDGDAAWVEIVGTDTPAPAQMAPADDPPVQATLTQEPQPDANRTFFSDPAIDGIT